MNRMYCRALTISLPIALIAAGHAVGQVGKGSLIDPNIATEAQLTAVADITPPVARSLIAKRPFASILAFDSALAQAGLTEGQRAEVYTRLFVHVNLNVANRDEVMLIPGAGRRMAREFDEYKPYTGGYAQFRREIGKYVPPEEVARLEQYTFIPINLNTATDEDLLSIPGLGPRMLREFKEYRPYRNMEQFRKEIGKYVDAKEVARLERYVTIQ